MKAGLVSIFLFFAFDDLFAFESVKPSYSEKVVSSAARHYSQVKWTNGTVAYWPSLKFYLEKSPVFRKRFESSSEVSVSSHCALTKKLFSEDILEITNSDFIATVPEENIWENIHHSSTLSPLDYQLSRKSFSKKNEAIEMMELRLVDSNGHERTFFQKQGIAGAVPISIDEILMEAKKAFRQNNGATKILFVHTHPYEAITLITNASTKEKFVKLPALSRNDIEIVNEIRRRAPQLDFHMVAIVGVKPELLCRLTYPI